MLRSEIPDSVLNQGIEISEEVMQDIVQNISSPVEMAAMIKDLGVPYSNKVHILYQTGWAT